MSAEGWDEGWVVGEVPEQGVRVWGGVTGARQSSQMSQRAA